MKSITSSPALAAILLSNLLSTTTASCAHNTFLHKRVLHTRAEPSTNETVRTVEVGKFGYIGALGPTNWQNLTPDNIACSTSTQQSPIDVTNTSTTLTTAGEVKLAIPNLEEAEFENLGTTIEVVMEGKGGTLTIPGGKEFELKQFHFHSPSEHTINGEYFPLEMHMVTQSAEDSTLAVASVLFSLSNTQTTPCSPLLLELAPSLSAISSPGSITTTGPLDFTSLITSLATQQLHTYNGSLTTPPCAEGLEFFITSQPLDIDSLTFNMFKSVIGFNSRFTQGVVGEPNLLTASSAGAVQSGGMVENVVLVPENETRFGKVANELAANKGGVDLNDTGVKKVEHIDAEGKAKLLKVVSEITGVDLSSLGL